MSQLDKFVVAMPVEFDHIFVVFEQTAAVGHREQSYLQLLCLQVQLRLHVHAHR